MPDLESRVRLQTIIRLRWIAVVGQLFAVVLVRFALGFDLPFAACLIIIALSAWVNVFLRVRFSSRARLSPELATALLAYDIVQLAGLLFLTGGVGNPFTILIVAPVTVSAATLPTRYTIALGTIAVIVAAVLVGFHLPLPWYPSADLELPMLYRAGMFAAVICCLAFLAFYVWRLAREAQLMSNALNATEMVLAREQKLHALDGLAAAAAHELGTPLATIVLVAKELERDSARYPDIAEDLALLRTQAQRCRDILQTLTRQPSERDPLHAAMTVMQLVDEAAEPHRHRSPTISIVVMPGVQEGREPVGERHPGVLYGLGNLIENAVDFAERQVQITAGWSADEVKLTISDDGPGFAPELLDQIGDPYITSRPAYRSRDGARKGTGLGLGFFIAKTLLERSGAQLALDNRPAPEHGAIVVVRWQRADFEAAGEATAGFSVLATLGG